MVQRRTDHAAACAPSPSLQRKLRLKLTIRRHGRTRTVEFQMARALPPLDNVNRRLVLLFLACYWSILLVAAAAALQQQAHQLRSTSDGHLRRRRIHIRRLPARFNAHLLCHCATAFLLADPASASAPAACASLANHGLGRAPTTAPTPSTWSPSSTAASSSTPASSTALLPDQASSVSVSVSVFQHSVRRVVGAFWTARAFRIKGKRGMARLLRIVASSARTWSTLVSVPNKRRVIQRKRCSVVHSTKVPSVLVCVFVLLALIAGSRLTRPARADAVFLPYYAALPYGLQPALLNSSALHGLPLARFLARHQPRLLARRHGHDHYFFFLAAPAWDYSQPHDADPRMYGTTSLLRRPELANFTVLTLKSRPWPWQEHAIPHPTSFHPRGVGVSGVRGGGAAVVVSKPSKPNIRGSILAECANRTAADASSCTVVDCSAGACALDPVVYMRPMLRAKFCLQPPGDTPSRRSTFDAGHRRRDHFSVTIPNKESVVLGDVRIADVLAAVPDAEVARMRARLLELAMAPRALYRRHGSTTELREASKDAVDTEAGARSGGSEGEPDAIYSLDDDRLA
ncbi:putative xyloglucan galactosyltransferase GT19 [Dichanthelium oligosanthes]|uniref:Putative xyloglucan galactosyltransferase GT19 n=1 Tax=Dichanthelium oligosanthes TaxID=888268 RepID=A0A1E5UNY3_9POAL|nr:putative xyloglucan galactosyltransferase GT19 [Dichanthelium oligosanthes]